MIRPPHQNVATVLVDPAGLRDAEHVRYRRGLGGVRCLRVLRQDESP